MEEGEKEGRKEMKGRKENEEKEGARRRKITRVLLVSPFPCTSLNLQAVVRTRLTSVRSFFSRG